MHGFTHWWEVWPAGVARRGSTPHPNQQGAEKSLDLELETGVLLTSLPACCVPLTDLSIFWASVSLLGKDKVGIKF